MNATVLAAVAAVCLTGWLVWRIRVAAARPRAASTTRAGVDGRRGAVALFEAGPDGRVSGCDETCLEMFGLSASEACGFDLGRVLMEEGARVRWRRWLEGGDPVLRLHARLKTARDNALAALLTVRRASDAEGEPRLRGAITESGEISAAVDALEREAMVLREIIATAPVGIATFDAEGRVGGVWNRAAETILGWAADEVRGEVLPLLPAAAPGGTTDGPAAVTQQVRRWRRDGEPVDLGITTAPISGVHGHTVAVLQDVTDRVRSEAERRRFAEIIRSTPELVLILDVDGALMYQNPAARARFAATGGGADGPMMGTEWGTRWRDEIVPVVASGDAWTGELKIGPDGGFLASVVVSGHRSIEGNLAYLSVLARDISKQRSVEEQLRQAQKLEAVGQLSGGIAHDFNNLLTVVQANVTLLADGDPTTDPALLLADIEAAAKRGRDLVRRLMVFSRKETLDVRPYCLDDLEDYVRTLRRLLPETVNVRWRSEAPAAVIQADSGALQQILLNLATNARDAMPQGGVLTIAVEEAAPSASRPRAVQLSVSDTGTGIAPSQLERIFEPFYTTKTPGRGTGLGLAMVYALVQELGGEITVDSEPGAGTTFRLLFPRARGASARIEVADSPPPVEGNGETILVVEDEAPIRRVCRRSLERVGYQVLLAADGEAGLEVFRSQAGAIDLVISDVVMPKMDGPRLLERIRADGYDVPFMFMTGYTESEMGEKVDTRRVSILSKPWSRDGLQRSVARALGKAQVTDPGAVPS